ncbi:MAG: TrmH family RNA methyltransferase, partial [Flavobacteriaceae bacterium]
YDYKGPPALILGAEDKGISKGILKIVKQQAKIPMVETSNSLNVSVAAAVVLYEIVRQRL